MISSPRSLMLKSLHVLAFVWFVSVLHIIQYGCKGCTELSSTEFQSYYKNVKVSNTERWEHTLPPILSELAMLCKPSKVLIYTYTPFLPHCHPGAERKNPSLDRGCGVHSAGLTTSSVQEKVHRARQAAICQKK